MLRQPTEPKLLNCFITKFLFILMFFCIMFGILGSVLFLMMGLEFFESAYLFGGWLGMVSLLFRFPSFSLFALFFFDLMALVNIALNIWIIVILYAPIHTIISNHPIKVISIFTSHVLAQQVKRYNIFPNFTTTLYVTVVFVILNILLMLLVTCSMVKYYNWLIAIRNEIQKPMEEVFKITKDEKDKILFEVLLDSNPNSVDFSWHTKAENRNSASPTLKYA